MFSKGKVNNFLNRVYYKVKIKKSLNIKDYVFVETFNGKALKGNPYWLGKYIASKENLPLVISYNDKLKQKENTDFEIYINRSDYKFKEIATNAKYVIVNNDIYIRNFNPKGFYIQTWHGTPLKKIGRDVEDISMMESYINKFEYQLTKANLLLAQNEYSKDIFYRAFNYKKEPQVLGYPKNDYIVNSLSLKQELKEKLEFSGYAKIILYAPTWRDDSFHNDKRCYKPLINFSKLSNALDDNTLFIIKPHDNEKQCILEYPKVNNIKILPNVDLNDLFIISDKLITDYSSIFFDYMLTSNKITFYAPDYKKYKETLRDFYFEYSVQNLPGEICFTEDELYCEINEYEVEDEIKYNKLKEKYLPLDDGKVCERIYNVVKNK